jgi:hypothetical protein
MSRRLLITLAAIVAVGLAACDDDDDATVDDAPAAQQETDAGDERAVEEADAGSESIPVPPAMTGRWTQTGLIDESGVLVEAPTTLTLEIEADGSFTQTVVGSDDVQDKILQLAPTDTDGTYAGLVYDSAEQLAAKEHSLAPTITLAADEMIWAFGNEAQLVFVPG